MGSGADKVNRVLFEDDKRIWKEKMKIQKEPTANDTQVGGNHYKNANGYQHWDIVAEHDLNYFEGQITKYAMRCRKKEDMLKDLRKAQHFIAKYIELVEQGRIPNPTTVDPQKLYEQNMERVYTSTVNKADYAPAHLASTI